jgi:polysaccharide biosynthesis/export protein
MIHNSNPVPTKLQLPSVRLICNTILIVTIINTLTSCVSSKNISYFSNLSDSGKIELPTIRIPQAVIMPDDMLEIRISGANEVTSALFNSYSANTGNNPNVVTPSYLVDNNGELEFPIIGKVKAAGLSRDAFKELLRSKVAKYLKDPLVSVRFLNFRFTVVGEVKTPGSFTVLNEKVTILEAVGMAGDMTTYGKRTNVRVIRDSIGKREIGSLNFNDKAVFTSPYYYLRRNDIVYIEPEKSKSRFEDFSRVSAIVATLASLVAIAVTVFR